MKATSTSSTTTLRRALLSRLFELRRDERGTSLTEFIIGMPVMITVMVGTLSLYKLHETGLEVKGEANRKVWADSLPKQTSLNPGLAISPLTSGIGDLLSGNLIGDDFGSSIGNLAADIPGGVYIDSFAKVSLADTVFNVGKKPQYSVERILMGDSGGDSNSITAVTMSDLVSFSGGGGGGWEGAVSSVLGAAGARPGMAAGIRYGIATSEEVSREYNAHGFSTTFKGEFHLPYPTRPTNRMIGMAIARLDMNNHPVSCSKKFYKDAVLPFKLVPQLCFGSGPSAPSPEEIDEMSQQCEQEMEAYSQEMSEWASCKARVISIGCGSEPQKPECARGSDSTNQAKANGRNMIDCIQRAAEQGKSAQEAGCV